MSTQQSSLRSPSVTVSLGEGGRVLVQVREADGTRGTVDLDDRLADVISLGAGAGPFPDPGPDGVELATIEVVGPVRVWVDGRRIPSKDVATHVGTAIVAAVHEAARRAEAGTGQ